MVGGRPPAELLGVRGGTPSEVSASRGSSTSRDSTASVHVADVVAVDEQAGVADDDGQAADVGGDDRGAARLGLECDQPERLAVRGHEDEVGGAVPLRQLRPGDRRDEPGLTSSTPSSRGERLELAGAGEAGAARAAEDGERQAVVVAPVGVPAQQLGADAQQHVGRA